MTQMLFTVFGYQCHASVVRTLIGNVSSYSNNSSSLFGSVRVFAVVFFFFWWEILTTPNVSVHVCSMMKSLSSMARRLYGPQILRDQMVSTWPCNQMITWGPLQKSRIQVSKMND